MVGILSIVYGDTRPTLIQYQSTNGLNNEVTVIDITDSTVICRVATTPVTTVITGNITNGANGECAILFSMIPVGNYFAELSREDSSGSQTSESFQLKVRSTL